MNIEADYRNLLLVLRLAVIMQKPIIYALEDPGKTYCSFRCPCSCMRNFFPVNFYSKSNWQKLYVSLSSFLICRCTIKHFNIMRTYYLCDVFTSFSPILTTSNLHMKKLKILKIQLNEDSTLVKQMIGFHT